MSAYWGFSMGTSGGKSDAARYMASQMMIYADEVNEFLVMRRPTSLSQAQRDQIADILFKGRMTMTGAHQMAGRMINDSGAVTFCACGLAFFAPHPDTDGKFSSDDERHHARVTADLRWKTHAANAISTPPGPRWTL